MFRNHAEVAPHPFDHKSTREELQSDLVRPSIAMLSYRYEISCRQNEPAEDSDKLANWILAEHPP